MTKVPECITRRLFETALQRYFNNKDVHVMEYTCALAVPASDSYNSSLIRSSITYSTGINGNQETISVIVKCCPKPDNDQFEVTNNMRFFEKEIQMYTKVLPEVHDVLGNLGILSPKCIYIEEAPIRIIIMEDLSKQGFKMLDRREGLDLEHCKVAVEKLAQLHAASVIVYEKKPHAFSIFYQSLFPGNAAINYWIKVAITEIIKTCASRPNMKQYVEKLKQYKGKVLEKCEEAAEVSADFNVLNHGDCWTNNLLYQYDSKGTIQDVRMVDYQIGKYSSPAIDLHYFWATSPNLEVRRLHLNTILDCYYDKLVSTLATLKYSIDRIPSKKDFQRDWLSRSHYGFAGFVTVGALTKSNSRDDACVTNLLDPEKGDEDSFRHHVFNSSLYLEHLEYALYFFDNLGIFDC